MQANVQDVARVSQEHADEILSQVEVDHFEAEPATIPPFGHSRLRWKVSAPHQVSVQINSIVVGHEGSKSVSPFDTAKYSLTASFGGYTESYGTKTVSVDVSSCKAATFQAVKFEVKAALIYLVDHKGDLYWRRIETHHSDGTVTYENSVPEVTILPNQVKFHLPLKGGLDWAPNPAIDIYGEFSFGVAHGQFPAFGAHVEAANITTKANIDIGVLGGLLGLITHGVGPTHEKVKEKERSIELAMVDGIKQIAKDVVSKVYKRGIPGDYEPHSARVFPVDEEGVLEIMYCPETAGVNIVG